MGNIIQFKRGTRTGLNTLAGGNNILAGQPYLITDEGRLAIGLTPSTFSTFLKQGESSNIADGDKGDITVSGTGANWSVDADVRWQPKLAPLAGRSLGIYETEFRNDGTWIATNATLGARDNPGTLSTLSAKAVGNGTTTQADSIIKSLKFPIRTGMKINSGLTASWTIGFTGYISMKINFYDIDGVFLYDNGISALIQYGDNRTAATSGGFNDSSGFAGNTYTIPTAYYAEIVFTIAWSNSIANGGSVWLSESITTRQIAASEVVTGSFPSLDLINTFSQPQKIDFINNTTSTYQLQLGNSWTFGGANQVAISLSPQGAGSFTKGYLKSVYDGTTEYITTLQGQHRIRLATGTGSTTGLEVNTTSIVASLPVATLVSAAGSAGFKVPHGVAPTAPVNGDFWSTTAGFYGQVNGVTVGPFGAGGGGISSVSVATANGISGSSSGGSTPALTIVLGAITPTSVAASGTVTGSNLSGTNTGDQTTITGNAGSATSVSGTNTVTYTNLAQSPALTVLGNPTNATANKSEIVAATDFTILRRNGTALAFGAIDLSQAGAVGTSRLGVGNLVQASAASFFGATAAGNFGELTPTVATSLLNTFTATLKGLVPLSGGGTTNYLRADGTWGTPSLVSDPIPLATATEASITAPVAGNLKVFARSMAGREMLGVIGSDGDKTVYQTHMGRNNISIWDPLPGVATIPVGSGIAAPTSIGTATARAPATTNMATRLLRLGYAVAATAGLIAGQYWTINAWTIGSTTTLVGGFHLIYRFMPSDPATVSGARMFVGMSNTVAAPTNVEPSALLNCIGLAQLSTSTNLQIVYGGSTAQTPIDLGVNFPANTLSTEAYELQLFASPVLNTVGYRVERMSTGQTATGTLTAATAGTQLPLNATLMTPRAWRTNNATALAVGLDVISMYLESDN